MNAPRGGTEILFEQVAARLGKEYESKINLFKILDIRANKTDRKNVCWNHMHIDEPGVQGHMNPNLVAGVDKFVFVSHNQCLNYLQYFKLPPEKCVVLKNATDGVPYLPKQRSDKLKIMYTSTPWRGLDVLLKAYEILNRDDVELHVYSSTKIYGDGFEKSILDEESRKQFEEWYEVAGMLPNSYYHGYAPNEEVREQLKSAHIFAYPCTFWETSCLAAIEAMMAGCKVVTTNFGAMPETCSEWATYVPYGPDRINLAERFAETLNREIDRYWEEENQKRLERQVNFYNQFYSWDARIPEWKQLFDSLLEQSEGIKKVA